MDVSEIQVRVKRTFGDESGVQLTDADIIRWTNDAMREIALDNNLLQTRSSSNTVLDQSEYDVPAGILTLRSVKYQGNRLQGLTLSQAEAMIPNIDDSVNYPSGQPTHFWVWANKITLYPKPDVGTANGLTMYYTAQPTPVVVNGDVPVVPLQYHNRIVEYCIAQAYELDDDPKSYQAKMDQFKQGNNELRDNSDWVQREVYPSITVSAGDVGYSSYEEY